MKECPLQRNVLFVIPIKHIIQIFYYKKMWHNNQCSACNANHLDPSMFSIFYQIFMLCQQCEDSKKQGLLL